MKPITRRDFLKWSSGGVSGVMLAKANGFNICPADSQMQEEKPNMQFKDLPTIPYGAVYFRKSNPPREDWERDYRQAAEDGMNSFRHWFLWSAIEIAPGKYDWCFCQPKVHTHFW